MPQLLTYNELWLIENDINQIRQASPAMDFLFAEKFKRFFQLNAIRLNTMHEKLGAIQRKYIEFNEQGQAQRSETEKMPNGDPEWKFKASFIDAGGTTIIGAEEAKKQYYLEAHEFLSISFPVHT